MWKLYKWKQRTTIYTHVSGNEHVYSRVKVFVPFEKKVSMIQSTRRR